ncbi:MAG TPA: O-antigen ligase family protein [Candidatus Acidoferrales bacterium]|jgi:O-antigen ligase|nr:O-antigen ligase family protein [Candidatus Acidoferrales bacterium]
MVLTRKNLEWWCERGMLFLILGMLVFAPLAFGAVEPWAYLIVEGMAAGVFILWAAKLWLSPKTKILWPPLAWVVLAFTVYAVARYFAADIEYVARLEVLQVLFLAFIFFVVMNTLRGQEETEWVSYTLIGLATLIACYAVGQLVSHSDRVWNVYSDNAARAGGTYISPNHLAGFLEMILPLALAFLLVGKVKAVSRVLLGYAVVAMMAGLAVTFSRAGWVAAAAGIFLVLGVLLGHRNHRLRAMILLAVMLAGGGMFVSHYLSKTAGFTHRMQVKNGDGPSNYDWTSRLMMWDAAERMWLDHPWWGVGPAHYDYRFREYRPADLQARPDRCHNDYLNLLADWGVVGGVIVLAGMGIFVVGLFKTWPHVRREENDFGSGQSNRFAFFLGATGGLAALAVHSTMDFNLHIPANALVGVTLLGLLASNLRFATEQYWVRAGVPLKAGLAGVLVAVVALFAVQEWRQSREVYWQARAEREGNFSPERATALEKAFNAEPKNFQTAYDIGECYRTEGLEGGRNYQQLTQKAKDWYVRAMPLNPHDGYNYLRTGMCLDWLGEHAASEKYYSEAELRDPNGYYLVANLGWHYVQIGDYAAARQLFIRSLSLFGNNPTAKNYLYICEPKLIEKASGRPVLPAFY